MSHLARLTSCPLLLVLYDLLILKKLVAIRACRLPCSAPEAQLAAGATSPLQACGRHGWVSVGNIWVALQQIQIALVTPFAMSSMCHGALQLLQRSLSCAMHLQPCINPSHRVVLHCTTASP